MFFSYEYSLSFYWKIAEIALIIFFLKMNMYKWHFLPNVRYSKKKILINNKLSKHILSIIMVVFTIWKFLLSYLRSGIDEENGEKEMLLDEIVALVEEDDKQKEKEKEKKAMEENSAKNIRQRALESLTPRKVSNFCSSNSD